MHMAAVAWLNLAKGLDVYKRQDEALALAAHPIPDDLWSEMEALMPGPEHWLR